MTRPQIVGLFEGYGGLTRAVQAATDGELVAYSEIEPAACRLLEHHHPGVPNLGDITQIDPRDIPMAHVLTFGWPCQPWSPAGKRLGEADPRALWPHIPRLVAALRPRILLGENVARIASNGELRRVVRSLAALGYVGSWRCVTASEVGAPHKRDRCFVVAVRADVAANPLGLELRDEPGRGGGPSGQGAGVAGHDGAAGPLRLLKTPTANLGSNGGSQHPDKRKAGGHGPTLADEVEWLIPVPQWGIYEAAIRRWERASGRFAPSPTMPSPKATGSPILAPAFVEWLMGLPAGHVTGVPGLSRNEQLKLLGNGVVPQQAEAALRYLLTSAEAQVAA